MQCSIILTETGDAKKLGTEDEKSVSPIKSINGKPAADYIQAFPAASGNQDWDAL